MNCGDCDEPITEAERLARRTCVVCGRPLHSECAMLGLDESDNCERCFDLEQKGAEDATRDRVKVMLGSEVTRTLDEKECAALGHSFNSLGECVWCLHRPGAYRSRRGRKPMAV